MPSQYSRKHYNEPEKGLEELREKIIGLGEESFRKSYYPELQEKLADLEKYKALLDQSNDAIFLIESPSGRFIDVSKAACKQLGYTARECLAMTLFDLAPGHTEDLKRIVSGETESLILEAMLRKGSGNLAPYEMNMRRVTFRNKDYLVVVARDITERKRAEEALRESEEKFRLVADFTYDWECWIGPTGDFLYVSPSCERVTGHGPNEFYRDPGLLLKLVHPDDKAAYEHHLEDHLIQGAGSSGIDYRIVTAGGETRWIAHVCQPVYGDNGEWLGRRSSSRDITVRKQAEEALRESEERFRALAQSSAAAIVVYQGERIVSVNPAAERITGYPKDELLKMKLIDIIHPDYKAMVLKRALRRQHGEPEPSQYETMIFTKSGEARWVLLSVGLMLYLGKPAGVVTLLDITERNRAEEALRKSEAHLAKSQEIAHLGSYNWDLIHKTDEWSDELYHILGIRPGEVKPSLEAYIQFVYPDDRKTVNKHLDDMFNKHEYTGGYEVRIVRPDGSIRWTRLDGEFALDESGKVAHIFGTIMDITERKRAEEELARSKRQAELYLDLMSHDITNMNQALMGYLEMIDIMRESGEIDKALIDNSIEVINRSSRMISDVKKLTQIQAGKVPWKDIDVCKILSTVKSRYSSVLNKRVTINYTPCENCIVRSGDLLEDVFDNLVANAVRHSSGPVTVDITVDRVTLEGLGYYQITVADAGPGIPDDLKKKLFMTIKEIEVGEKTGRRGFGLYLVRTLVDYYHGKVWVEDRVPGDYTKGARFVVMLPMVER